MTHLVDKDALVAEIERRVAEGEKVVKELPSSAIMGLIQAYKNTLSFIDTLEVKEVPIWEKVSPDTGQTILYKDGSKSYLERFGYRIDLKDLDKLPKKNSTHRTPADIESAMQEVEAKSEAYTNAHRGERADDVLSQMRGEPVSEELEKAAEDYSNNLDNIYGSIGKQTRYAFKAGAQWQRDQILNSNATLLRTFELGKIEMKHQILKAMDLGEPPYLISVEKAYYDVKKLLEDEV